MKKGSAVSFQRRSITSRVDSLREPKPPQSYIYTNDPDTLALLLKTSEVKCVIQALDLLYDLILQNKNIGRNLLSKGIIEDILSLPKNNYPYYNGARYRFLAKMLTLFPEIKPSLKRRPDFVYMAMEDAMKTEDTPLKAYALQYVSCMTQDNNDLLCMLTKLHDLNKIFSDFLVDSDVDVQNNALALLRNLVTNPRTVKQIPDLNSFHLEPLCAQVGCPYPDIQNKALDILYVLTSWEGKRRQWLQELFSNAGGIDLLLTILFIFQWRDVHMKCLKILENLAESTINLLNMESVQGIARLVQYLEFIEDEELKAEDLVILLKICKFDEGKLVLIQNSAVAAFVKLLEKGFDETKIRASEGLKILSEDSSSIPQMSEHNPVPLLIDIILNEENSPELQCKAGTTLNSIIKTVPVCTLSLSKKENFERLHSSLKRQFPIDVEWMSQVFEAMSTVLSFPTHLTSLINKALIKDLLKFLYVHYGTEPQLAVYTIEILSWTLNRQYGRDLFIANNGVNDIMKILYRSHNNDILNAIGLLLIIAFKDQILSECFIWAGIDTWLLICQNLWKNCPNLAEATDVLFSNQLALKFEYNGRLDIWDKTSDGFYVCRSLETSEDFPLLCDLVHNHICPSRPVFYVFTNSLSTTIQQEGTISMFNLVEEDKIPSENDYEEMGSVNCQWSLLRVAKLQHQSSLRVDERLQEILNEIENELQSTLNTNKKSGSERFHRHWIEKVAHVIGKKVADAMSGHKYENKCTHHNFELHVKELKLEFGTSCIPIGALEVGLKLERAILFKVLADRLDLPCALVRGEYATGWVEVAIPEMGNETAYKELPIYQLVTNHLVDLMVDPGAVIPLESEFAAIYCGMPRKSLVNKYLRKPQTLRPGRPNEQCKGRQLFHIEIE